MIKYKVRSLFMAYDVLANYQNEIINNWIGTKYYNSIHYGNSQSLFGKFNLNLAKYLIIENAHENNLLR